MIWTSSTISSSSSSALIELLSLVNYMFTIDVVSSGGVGCRLGEAGLSSAGALGLVAASFVRFFGAWTCCSELSCSMVFCLVIPPVI